MPNSALNFCDTVPNRTTLRGMRLFVGIPLPDALLQELAAAVECLRSARGEQRQGSDGLRWIASESWHITLQFLGSATAEQLDCLNARLGEVRSDAVPIQLGDLGCFDRAGVLFASVTVTPELAALQQKVLAATARCRFVAEDRPFHPHITLARSKGHRGGPDLQKLLKKLDAQPASARFVAREFLLYESHLVREGARYEVKRRFDLHNRPPTVAANQFALKQDGNEQNPGNFSR